MLGLMLVMITSFSGCLKSLVQEAVKDAIDEGSSTYTDNYGSTASLPSAWPSDFPLNSDWSLSSSSASTYDTDMYLSVTQTCSNCTKDEVVEYYRGVLGANGWTEYSYSEYASDFITESATLSFDKGYDKYATVDYSVYDYGYGDKEIEIYLSYSEYYY